MYFNNGYDLLRSRGGRKIDTESKSKKGRPNLGLGPERVGVRNYFHVTSFDRDPD